jgi:hypothetical protein
VKWTWKRGWWASQSWMAGGLLRSVVVADQVDVEAGLDVLVDLLEELQELLVAVAAVQFADHGAVGDVWKAANRLAAPCRAESWVLLGHPGHHRQHRLGPAQSR